MCPARFSFALAPLIGLAMAAATALPAAAQLDEPDPSCFEPVKPACAEVTVGSEDDGWAMRCREELDGFLTQVDEFRTCIIGRIDRLEGDARSEMERLDCTLDPEGEGCD